MNQDRKTGKVLDANIDALSWGCRNGAPVAWMRRWLSVEPEDHAHA